MYIYIYYVRPWSSPTEGRWSPRSKRCVSICMRSTHRRRTTFDRC